MADPMTLMPPTGMISLRGDPAQLAPICAEVTGLAMPGKGKAVTRDETGLLWMSPDEVLMLLPHGAVGDALAKIGTALQGQHHLAVDVSDARVMIPLDAATARATLSRVVSVDLHPKSFGPGDLRRTRLDQIAAAFWMEEDESVRLICFRSVADYALALLNASRPRP